MSGMTLEAWVNPTALGGAWRTVMLKEQPAASPTRSTRTTATGARRRTSPPVRVSHRPAGAAAGLVAPGRDLRRRTLRLYVNGDEIASARGPGALGQRRARCGSAATRSGREWFAGRIDELRVYNRALSAAEVRADMTRPVSAPASRRGSPSTPGVLAFSGVAGRRRSRRPGRSRSPTRAAGRSPGPRPTTRRG